MVRMFGFGFLVGRIAERYLPILLFFCLGGSAWAIVDPENMGRWEKPTNNGAYSPVGRQGLSIIVHKLANEPDTTSYVNRVTSGLVKAKHRLNDGHGDNVLSMFWALLGIQASGNKAAIREVLDYSKAFINMSRTHDGSFVAQPGRNNGDKGYYLSSRVHPTAAMILILSMDQPTLTLQCGH